MTEFLKQHKDVFSVVAFLVCLTILSELMLKFRKAQHNG
jgi:hypothetical protein